LWRFIYVHAVMFRNGIFKFKATTEVWFCNTIYKKFSKTYFFLLSTYLVFSNLFCGIFDLATPFINGMYLLNREKRYWRCSEINIIYIIQVLNELPTDERHMKVQQDRLLCPTHFDNKKKTGFRKCSFYVCYTTRPQYSLFNGAKMVHVIVNWRKTIFLEPCFAVC